jgi:CheY-like chemotaxis protein
MFQSSKEIFPLPIISIHLREQECVDYRRLSIIIRKTLARALYILLKVETLQAVDVWGLRACRVHLYDVVMCDFLMPVMDSWTAFREYRKWGTSVDLVLASILLGLSARVKKKKDSERIAIGTNNFVQSP